MKILIILCHYKKKSLTYQIKDSFVNGLKEIGNEVDILDLFEINFNPVLTEKDEPKWKTNERNYSDEVKTEMERLLNYDSIVFIFPMYWWNMPAMLKGYIDRVFNYNFAYGNGYKLSIDKILWLTLGGSSHEKYINYKYDEMVKHYFNIGLADYWGIKNSKVKIFYKTTYTDENTIQTYIKESYQEGLNFNNW